MNVEKIGMKYFNKRSSAFHFLKFGRKTSNYALTDHIVFLCWVVLTEYVAIEPKVCICMCVCGCMYVCVWQRYSPEGWMDFDDFFYKWSDKYLRGPFFLDFEISKSMTSWRQCCTFSPGHSHGRNFDRFSSNL